MKGILKIFLGLVLTVIVLMVLAAVLLPLIYDKEDLGDAISKQVQKQTGRELSINGELDFSVFPWLAVEVSDLSLSNAEGFGDEPFAQVGKARVGVALLPLFQKQIAVDEITLDGLDLRLAVNQQGKNNWDDLSESESTSTAAEQEEPGMFSSQRVAGLNIRDANVEYRDRQAGSHYRLADFSLQTGALGEGRPVPLELSALIEDLVAGSGAEIGVSATVSVDADAEKYSLENFELTTELAASAGQSTTLALQSPRVDADLAAGTLELEAFKLQLSELQANGTLSATRILDEPAFSGTVSVAEFSPLVLMAALQLEAPLTADSDALQRAVLRTNFAGTGSQMKFSDFELELDQSRISGELNVRNFEQAKVSFDFNIDAIDLDRYLEPAGEDGATDEVVMPREELERQDLQGNLRIASLRLLGLDFDDAEVGVMIRDHKLRVHPLKAKFYGGHYSGDVNVDSSGSTPLISLNETIDSIAFQKLVSDLVDSEALSGMALGHVRLSGSGINSGEVLSSLRGELGLTLTEGALEGINIWYEIRRAYALYKRMAPPAAEPARTVFSRMQLSANVENGIVQTRELVADLPFLNISGKGAVDLGQSNVNLKLLANVRNTPELASDPLASDLAGKRFPFTISGPLDSAKISVDWEELLKGEATDMLLDRLGLKPKPADEEPGDGEQQESTDEDQLEEAAKGALFDLLSGKNKKKDEDDGR